MYVFALLSRSDTGDTASTITLISYFLRCFRESAKNLTMRMSMFMHYNFVPHHMTRKKTPAMAAGAKPASGRSGTSST